MRSELVVSWPVMGKSNISLPYTYPESRIDPIQGTPVVPGFAVIDLHCSKHPQFARHLF